MIIKNTMIIVGENNESRNLTGKHYEKINNVEHRYT
jgi:hypothetical protein